jgi:pimeloyl-ACP methyl ester carboxylesterase
MSMSFLLLLLFTRPPAGLETLFHQVHPVPAQADAIDRSRGQERAIVLLHGLRVHPISGAAATKATPHGWQKPGSALVRTLGADGDVFAFAYSQNLDLEDPAIEAALAQAVRRLRDAGYREIVLVGHSAGAVIARQYVEDSPDPGVTKVIQVCPPNGGSAWAKARLAVRAPQQEFVEALTKQVRQDRLARRADKTIPPGVEFVCVIGCGYGLGDGVVSCAAQWPADLQRQGVPAVGLITTHFFAMRNEGNAVKLAELVRTPQRRWSDEEVAVAKKRWLLNQGTGKAKVP